MSDETFSVGDRVRLKPEHRHYGMSRRWPDIMVVKVLEDNGYGVLLRFEQGGSACYAYRVEKIKENPW